MRHLAKKYILENQFIMAILFVLIGWFIYDIRDILVTLFTSFIIMAALYPYTEALKRKKFPHSAAVLIPYTVALLCVLLIIVPIIPFFWSQVTSFVSNLPAYLDQLSQQYHVNVDTSRITSAIENGYGSIGQNAFAVTGIVFGSLFNLLTMFILSLYLLVDHDRIKRGLVSLFPKESEQHAQTTIELIEDKLGAWTRGQLALSAVIGVMTYVALVLMRIDYAIPLALIAGILEIIPTMGPILSSIPAIIVALTISPTMTVIVIITYTMIQMLENNIVVPKIMQKAVGLNPIVIILATLIGAQFLGVMGALLSIPFVSMLTIMYNAARTFNGDH